MRPIFFHEYEGLAVDVPLMFCAEIDRFRLIQLIAWWARKNSGLEGLEKQRALAKKAEVHQSSISHLERFKDAALDPPNLRKIPDATSKRRLSRAAFIKIFAWGLNLSRADVDALLWLYDQQALTDSEVEHYQRGHEPDSQPQHYTESDYDVLRQRVLTLLSQVRKYCVEQTAKDGFNRADVKLIFDGTEEDCIRTWKELYRVEEQPGHRMMLMKHPSFLTFPQDVIQNGKVIEPWLSPDAKREVSTIAVKRSDKFLQHLELYGERAIHRKASLKRYLSEKNASYRPFEERCRQVSHWIELLRKYPHYHIGLSEHTPEFEFTIKGTVEVIMRGTSHEDNYDDRSIRVEKNMLVPRYVHWTDTLSVLSYYLTFETYWDTIPIEDRTKETVIAQLQEWVS